MSNKDPVAPGFKERAKEEFKSFLWISLYLAIFFCALVLYTKLTLRQHGVDTANTLNFTFAIINALVIAKVILIGEMAHLGRHSETRPVYQTALYKTLVFGLLLLAFHFVEEFIKRLIHHAPRWSVLRDIQIDEMVARAIVVMCAFYLLFALREIHRTLGDQRFRELLLASRATDNPSLPARS